MDDCDGMRVGEGGACIICNLQGQGTEYGSDFSRIKTLSVSIYPARAFSRGRPVVPSRKGEFFWRMEDED